MTPEDLFSLAGTLAMPAWLLLTFGPRRWPMLNAIPAYAVPLLLSALYTVLVLTHFAEAEGGYGTLAAVRSLFASDMALLAGWVHYLAFDLFIGAWAARRMDAAGISRIIQAFILPLIFLFGPLGLLLSFAIEAASRPVRPFLSLPAPQRT